MQRAQCRFEHLSKIHIVGNCSNVFQCLLRNTLMLEEFGHFRLFFFSIYADYRRLDVTEQQCMKQK